MIPNSDGKATSGAPFKPPRAELWNNMLNAGQAFANGQLSNGTPPPIRPRSTDIIKIKNTSDAARRKGEILMIEDKAIEDVTDENIWLKGIEPLVEGFVDCHFGILKEPAQVDDVVSVQVSGCCTALVDIIDEEHRRAKIVDEEFVLVSSPDGPLEILFAPDGTGEKTCVVRFAGWMSDEFWAVNIGVLPQFTPTFDTDMDGNAEISGFPEGVAAVIRFTDNDHMIVTDKRVDFVRCDDGTEIPDGTLICLGHVSGRLTLKFANCEENEELQELDETP